MREWDAGQLVILAGRPDDHQTWWEVERRSAPPHSFTRTEQNRTEQEHEILRNMNTRYNFTFYENVNEEYNTGHYIRIHRNEWWFTVVQNDRRYEYTIRRTQLHGHSYAAYGRIVSYSICTQLILQQRVGENTTSFIKLFRAQYRLLLRCYFNIIVYTIVNSHRRWHGLSTRYFPGYTLHSRSWDIEGSHIRTLKRRVTSRWMFYWF